MIIGSSELIAIFTYNKYIYSKHVDIYAIIYSLILSNTKIYHSYIYIYICHMYARYKYVLNLIDYHCALLSYADNVNVL